MNNRRDFLSTATLAAASTALPAVSVAGEFAGKIKKGVKFSMVDAPDLSIVDRFKMVKDAGFDGTELRTENRDDLKTYLEAVDKSGLRVHGIVNASNPDLETAVKFSSDVGGDSVLYVARYDHTRPLMESWKETQDIIRKG